MSSLYESIVSRIAPNINGDFGDFRMEDLQIVSWTFSKLNYGFEIYAWVGYLNLFPVE